MEFLEALVTVSQKSFRGETSGASVHTKRSFSSTKNAGFQKVPSEWRLLKTPASLVRVDGRKRMLSIIQRMEC